MVHKRFRNPRQGYARPQAKVETARSIEDAAPTAEVSGMADLMGSPDSASLDTDSITPQSAMQPPTEPEKLAVTRVVRGSAAEAQARQPTAIQRRIDRLIDMLRRSR